MLYTVPNKQTWNSILHNSNLGVRGPRYTRKFLEPKNRVNRGKGVRQSILFSFHNIRAIADALRPNPISDLNKNAINPDLLRPTANLQNSLVQEST